MLGVAICDSVICFWGVAVYSKAESGTPLKGTLGVATCNSVICFFGVSGYSKAEKWYSFKGNVRPSVLALSAFLSA